LRAGILDGRHPPGARLREVELAERYGVSRIPLREALRTLEAEGLVMGAANRGVSVRALERDDIDQLFAFRLSLERLTARAAATCKADLLHRVNERRTIVKSALHDGAMPTVIAEDRGFHADLAEAAANRHVIEALGARWAHITRAMHLFMSAITYPEDVWDAHTAIAQAVADGDTDGAERLIVEHIVHSRDIVLARIDASVAQAE
jgi:DNA-binding GntR family transcriptional regulator